MESPGAGRLVVSDSEQSRGFGRWTSTSSTPGGSISVTAPGLGGTQYGIQTVVNGATPQSVQDDSPSGETRFRARFYFNPNSFDTGEAQNHHRARLLLGFNAGGQRALTLVLRRQAGAFAIEGRIRQNDGSRIDSGFTPLTNAEHYIEIDWLRSGAGLNNGTFSLKIDGVAQPGASSIANDAQTIDAARLGALSVKTGAAGTMSFDEYESRRVNPIGPVS